MSRLTDLIAQAKAKDPLLGADLDREFKVLSSRLPFGLNFERHSPEAVELPQRPIRKGDKVRVLPERSSTTKGDQRLWQVKAIHKLDGGKVAHTCSEPPCEMSISSCSRWLFAIGGRLKRLLDVCRRPNR